jgi:hypothetical protein
MTVSVHDTTGISKALPFAKDKLDNAMQQIRDSAGKRFDEARRFAKPNILTLGDEASLLHREKRRLYSTLLAQSQQATVTQCA